MYSPLIVKQNNSICQTCQIIHLRRCEVALFKLATFGSIPDFVSITLDEARHIVHHLLLTSDTVLCVEYGIARFGKVGICWTFGQ